MLLALVAALVPGIVRAEWREASSPHFVILANAREREVRAFAEQLERFHSAVALVTGANLPKPSPSNRVTVYVVPGYYEVTRSDSAPKQYTVAFYRPMAGSTRAIVATLARSARTPDASTGFLLHRYVHHVMTTATKAPMPWWYSEGMAAFLGSAGFEADGAVDLGRPRYRSRYLPQPDDVTVTELLDPAGYPRELQARYSAFHDKSWLLFHYLTTSRERSGQLTGYLQRLGQGVSSRQAATEIFGELDALENELVAYERTRSKTKYRLPPERLDSAAVRIRTLSPGEDAMMLVRILSRRGFVGDGAQKLLPMARKVATRFPTDPAVLSALAEAEYDAGNYAEAIVAANAALARDPSQVNAYVQKGLALFRQAARDPDPVAAYGRAREPFLALNRIEIDHPVPLIYFYLSFVRAGLPATDNALRGLERAVELAPFDGELRMTLAIEQIRRGNLNDARRNLMPVAYDPHAGKVGESAQRALDRLDTPGPWDGGDMASLLTWEYDAE